MSVRWEPIKDLWRRSPSLQQRGSGEIIIIAAERGICSKGHLFDHHCICSIIIASVRGGCAP